MSENQVEIRYAIKYPFLKGKDNMKILDKIHSVYETDSILIGTVEERTKELRERTFSIFDKTKSRRHPITELDEPIAHYMQENPYAQTRELAEDFHVNKGTIKKNFKRTTSYDGTEL